MGQQVIIFILILSFKLDFLIIAIYIANKVFGLLFVIV